MDTSGNAINYWWPTISKQIRREMGVHTLTEALAPFWSISLHPMQLLKQTQFEEGVVSPTLLYIYPQSVFSCSNLGVPLRIARRSFGLLLKSMDFPTQNSQSSQVHQAHQVPFGLHMFSPGPSSKILVPRHVWLPSPWNLHPPPGCSMVPGMLGSIPGLPGRVGPMCLEMTWMMTSGWIEMTIDVHTWWLDDDYCRWLL